MIIVMTRKVIADMADALDSAIDEQVIAHVAGYLIGLAEHLNKYDPTATQAMTLIIGTMFRAYILEKDTVEIQKAFDRIMENMIGDSPT